MKKIGSAVIAVVIGIAAYILNHWSGSIFQAASLDQTCLALPAPLGAILAPTVFAPMTGFFFQTMSQVGMAAPGVAFATGRELWVRDGQDFPQNLKSTVQAVVMGNGCRKS
jgi:hypothetical protein